MLNLERENKHLTDKQLVILKDLLNAKKETILNKQLTGDEFSLDRNELSDPCDEASINQQTGQEIRFRNRESFLLKKISKSLDLINHGVYGLCDECGSEITFERLNARPEAELCITCKEEAEMHEKNNALKKKSKSLGKTIAEM